MAVCDTFIDAFVVSTSISRVLELDEDKRQAVLSLEICFGFPIWAVIFDAIWSPVIAKYKVNLFIQQASYF